jgi:putative ABC transport system ATP-binding protein
MSMTQPIIEVRALSKVYRKGESQITALDQVDLDVGPGEFLALMGPSGSGKSTLLNILAGLDSPTAGRVKVCDRELSGRSTDGLARWRNRNVGMVFQSFNLVSALTAVENVALPLALCPLSSKERDARAREALDLVGLADRAGHLPRELSWGQEQRVAIARAIVTDPTVILADEPTGNLDEGACAGVVELLGVLSERHGKTLVMVTHDERAAQVARTRWRLEKGKLARTH